MNDATIQQKITHKGRKNSKLQDLQRQEGAGEGIWNISEQIRVLLGTMQQRLRVVKNIAFTFVVLQNMLRTHQGRADRAHPQQVI